MHTISGRLPQIVALPVLQDPQIPQRETIQNKPRVIPILLLDTERKLDDPVRISECRATLQHDIRAVYNVAVGQDALRLTTNPITTNERSALGLRELLAHVRR